ncbi:MAG: hypothetical protein AAF434_00760 [Pseudomonadota bacterium]
MNHQPWLGRFAAVWGAGGFLALLVFALYRLTPIAIEGFSVPWQWYHWVVFVANSVFMAYSEGYKGFQINYSPRLAGRARYLLQNATPLTAILAPFFCMSFFAAEKRRVITSWVLTAMIIVFIVAVQSLPQPWRGLLDAGVVVGLAWGIVTTLICLFASTNSQATQDIE